MPCSAAHHSVMRLRAEAIPRPRQSARTAVKPCSARSGTSSSRWSEASPTISSGPARARNVASGVLIHSRSHSSSETFIGETTAMSPIATRPTWWYARGQSAGSSATVTISTSGGTGGRGSTPIGRICSTCLSFSAKPNRCAKASESSSSTTDDANGKPRSVTCATRARSSCVPIPCRRYSGSTRGITDPRPPRSDRSAEPEPTMTPSRSARSSRRLGRAACASIISATVSARSPGTTARRTERQPA